MAKKETAVKKTNAKKNAPMSGNNAVKRQSYGRVTKRKNNKFDDAKSIQLTKNSIVVTRVSSKNAPGRYVKTETRRYYPKTPENMQELTRAISGKQMKKAGFELK